jgi:mannose-6-phosphate isomerase-like protein (cupin superfamily)
LGDRIEVRTGEEIVNPRTGQRMTFRRTAADTNGRELILECWSPPEGEGQPREPVHVHPKQEKRFEIIGGELTVLLGGTTRTLRAGDEIVVPANAVHAFWNEGTTEAHYWQEFRPAMRSAEFFTTLFALARDGELNDRGMPGPLQVMATASRFKDEVMVVNPPAWLQRVMFAFAPVARLLGRRAERR